MSLCIGVSHSLKANNATVQPVTVVSFTNVEQLSGRFGISNHTTQHQIKQELAQSIESLTQGIRQTTTAIVDLVMSTVGYVFLLVAQAFASSVLDR